MSLQRFLLYCNPDGTCSLKLEGEALPPQVCENLVEGVVLAQNLKGENQMQLTVYDPEGRVLLQSFA